MKEYIHLFTPVSDGLPQLGGTYICIIDGSITVNEYFSGIKRFGSMKVTHWLNLSKLTTKEKAEELAFKSFVHGCHVEMGHSNQPYGEFINENKNLL